MISDSEEITGKIVNILAYQAVITAQGESYTGEKDWALNKLTQLFHHQLQKARQHELEVLAVHLDRQLAGYTSVGLDSIYRYIEDRQKAIQAELNPPTSPVYDFFTAPEEVQRPVYERALQKAQEEQEKLVKATAFEKVSTQFGNAIKKLGSDQPTTYNRIGGHLGDSCCYHTKTCDLDLYPTNNQTL